MKAQIQKIQNIFDIKNQKPIIASCMVGGLIFVSVYVYQNRKWIKDAFKWYRRCLFPFKVEINCMNYVFSNATNKEPASILKAIDDFVIKKDEFLMNIGSRKGPIIINQLKELQPKKVLELGSYIGYSAVLIASELSGDAKLISLEIEPVHSNIANQILKYASLDKIAESRIGSLEQHVEELKNEVGSFDLIFIDHAKEKYVSDFILLEKSKLISDKTVIVADNIIYPGAPDYLEYIKKDYETTLVESIIDGYGGKERDAIAITKKKKSIDVIRAI